MFFTAFDLLLFFGKNKNNQNILVVRPDGIGDFILWLSAAKSIRNHFSKQKITLLVQHQLKEYAEHFKYWDNVISIDIIKYGSNILYRASVNKKVRDKGYNIVLCPLFSRSALSDSLVRASQSKKRIGWNGDYSNSSKFERSISDTWYTNLIESKNSNLTHELHRNRDFCLSIGIKCSPKIEKIAVILDPAQKPDDNYFIIFPSAGQDYRTWESDKFIEMINFIQKDSGLICVLAGSNMDMEKSQKIESAIKNEVVNLTGKTSLAELTELIRSASFLLSNETSAVHIAAAVQTPSFCILGGGHYGRFVPYPEDASAANPVPVFHEMDCYGCNWQCIFPIGKDETIPCFKKINIVEMQTVLNNHGFG